MRDDHLATWFYLSRHYLNCRNEVFFILVLADLCAPGTGTMTPAATLFSFEVPLKLWALRFQENRELRKRPGQWLSG